MKIEDIKKSVRKYIEGMKKEDPAYRYPSYIFLFLMLMVALIEPLPNIVRGMAAVFTLISSVTISVLRK